MPERRAIDPVARGAAGLYRALTWLASPIVTLILLWRRSVGKEHPERWREKTGRASLPRPEGKLLWLHAVGLGEVLSLRGLAARLKADNPDLAVLVTSHTRASGEAFARNAPAGVLHQYLPLDAEPGISRFLDHWKPDAMVWTEQDIWPGFALAAARRNIPSMLVNGRMNEASYNVRKRLAPVYRAIYGGLEIVTAQDETSARHLEALGAPGPVPLNGRLKGAAPPLADQPERRAALEARFASRSVVLGASTHGEDEALLLAALPAVKQGRADTLLIIAPRFPERSQQVRNACNQAGFDAVLVSEFVSSDATPDILIADSLGEMGLWYRLAPVAFIGGTLGDVEGHNPWEAARLQTAILHGPRTANFLADFSMLDRSGAALCVHSAHELAAALERTDHGQSAALALQQAESCERDLADLSKRVADLIIRRA